MPPAIVSDPTQSTAFKPSQTGVRGLWILRKKRKENKEKKRMSREALREEKRASKEGEMREGRREQEGGVVSKEEV